MVETPSYNATVEDYDTSLIPTVEDYHSEDSCSSSSAYDSADRVISEDNGYLNSVNSEWSARLVEQLRAASILSAFEKTPYEFVPEGVVDELVTKDIVSKCLQDQGRYSDLVDFVFSKARKAFAVATFAEVGSREAMLWFYRRGLSDSDLPISEQTQKRKKSWRSAFYKNQWRFLAPVFQVDIPEHLTKDHILPFMDKPLGVGRVQFKNSSLYQIHKNHVEPRCSESGMYIVRKRNLRHKVRKNIDTYQIEVELLQKIEELKHSHLVRFITAFGQQSYSRNKEYYLIFEWADGGNLRDFWSRHPSPKVTSFFIKDMINQLHGLITALRAVHCFEMHYTHGNLKPENILVFKNSIVDGIGTLKIGNWTQAEFYDEVTPLHFVTTQDGSDTCRYEAPEVETSKSSPGGRKNRHTRLNDIWSMGCITFEFIVWLLYGMSGLNKFIRDLGKNPFYQLFGEGRRKFARIHGVVVRWMDRMEEEFSCKAGETAIGDLLAIVREHLLVVSLPSDLPKRGHYGPVNGSSNTFEILAVAPGIPTKSVSLAELEQVHHEKIVRSSGAETTASIRCLAPEFSQYLEGILAREHKQRYWELRSYDDFATASTLQGEESVGENDHDTLVEEEEIPSDNYGIRLMDHDDPLEVSSVSSHITTARKRDGKAHLAQFLATDAELRVLCASVIEKLGEAVFANEGRKILKGFYLGMLGDAKTELQKQSVALLKSRSGRTRMSMQMAKMVIGAKMKDVEDVKDRIQADEQVRMREERLEMWAGIYAHNLRADEDPAQIDPEYAHAPETEWTLTESNSDGEAMSESDTREKILPKVTEMEEFFRNSKSFEMLLEGFRGVLLPPALRDILPANFVETSTEEDLSISNQIKSFVEDFTMLDWDWWPLRPRMRVLKPSERRLVWICSCGTRLWKEISVEEAESIDRILPLLKDISLRIPQCSKASDLDMWKCLADNFWNSVWAFSKGQNKTAPNASGSTTSSSTNVHAVASNQAAKPHPLSQNPNTSSANQQHNCTSSPGGSSSLRWIIFGSQSTNESAKLEHIEVDDFTNDSRFFRSLRDHYRRHRGLFKLWFSFWRVGACDGVRFDRIASNHVFLERPELPTDFNEYVYNPKAPPIGEAKNPLINRHISSKFLSCDNPCRWRLFHTCVPDLVNRRVIERVPRKRSVFDILNDNSAEHQAWGLTIRLEVSARYVAFYHLLILVVPFVFWGWWQANHPDDLQNASVPVTVALGFLSLFWGTNGILTQGRQFGERIA